MAEYQVLALHYASYEDRLAGQNFIFADAHDAPMPMDYYLWVIRNDARTIVVDTGFGPAVAARRGRVLRAAPEAMLRQAGIAPETVADVVITHMHYDHAGNLDLFPRARFHIQDAEMAYCTGRCMCHRILRMPVELDDVIGAVRRVHEGKMRFHDGEASIAPGISLHLIGGHSGGLQAVRVDTARGAVVLAGDATHFWANIRGRNPFPIVVNVAQMLEGYDRIEALADGEDHIIPGHDPLVRARFPDRDGAIRLDLPPER